MAFRPEIAVGSEIIVRSEMAGLAYNIFVKFEVAFWPDMAFWLEIAFFKLMFIPDSRA